MAERKKGSLADALTTVWLLVLSVWMFMEGYSTVWLVGVPVGLTLAAGLRWVMLRKERGK